MPGPTDPPPTVQRLATRWRSAVAGTGLDSISQPALLEILVELSREVLDVVAAAELETARLQRVGARLVQAHLTEVEALQATLSVLGDELAAGSGGSARIAGALGALAAGYAGALCEHTRGEQQRIMAAAMTARLPAEARSDAVFDVAAIGIAVARVDGEILEVNRAMCDMLGYLPGELVGRPFWEFRHPEDLPGLWDRVAEVMAGTAAYLRTEKRCYRKDGSTVLADVVITRLNDPGRRPRYLVGMAEDITEQRRLEDRLNYEATHDPLTGLPNRRMFFERLDARLSETDGGAGVGLCYLDVDGFKAINDTLGHDIGDALLRTVAQRLATELGRHGHLVARMGGDEFVVLVQHTAGLAELERVAAEALDVVRLPVPVAGSDVQVSASLGVLRHDGGPTTAAELMKAADTTMYWAKTDGRDRYALFDAERHRADVRRFALSARMPEALARGEFVVEYQPLVRLCDQRMIGVEALVRWQLPSGRRLGPGEFVPLAEQTGLIVPLGRAVLTEACRAAAGWAAADPDYPLLLSVNLAARQVREPDIVTEIARIVADSGWHPELLQLELTESDLMGTSGESLRALRALAAMGVRIAIDDFGTGYSNLAYLRHLPVHTLKLAGTFVTGAQLRDGLLTAGPGEDADEADNRVLAAMIQLAEGLGLSVTAESVETEAQVQRLRRLGCDTGQGWYFARSVPPDEVRELLHSPPWLTGATTAPR